MRLQAAILTLVWLEQDGREKGTLRTVLAVSSQVNQVVFPCLDLEASLGGFCSGDGLSPIEGGYGLGFLRVMLKTWLR